VDSLHNVSYYYKLNNEKDKDLDNSSLSICKNLVNTRRSNINNIVNNKNKLIQSRSAENVYLTFDKNYVLYNFFHEKNH